MVYHHQPPEGVGPQTKVWIREDEKASTYRWVNKGGPAKDQVCCRVTKDIHGNLLELKQLTGQETMEELTQPLDGPPRAILTEFWYDSPDVKEANHVHYIQAQKPGLAIADSGCRNSVGGEAWHEHLQSALKAHGIPWLEIPEKEVYKFGAGAPITSTTACLYPVLIHGTPDVIRMSVVGKGGSTCPGLIGPGELSRWNAVFHFKDKEMELNGVKKEMRLTATRHPGVELVNFEKEAVTTMKAFWHSQEGASKKRILQDTPQSYAFLTGPHEEGEEESLEEVDEEVEPDPGKEEADEREEKVKAWTEQLEDLGITMVPTHQEEDDASSTATEQSEAHASSTSHEKGVDFVTDDSGSEEEAGEHMSRSYVADVKTAHKGIRKKLSHTMREIKKTFQDEEVHKKEEAKKAKESQRQNIERKKRKKTWTIVEIFTWTCAISIMANLHGWTASEPISLPHWDILKSEDRKAALSYLEQLDPDVMVIAWPCTVWSPLQAFGNKSPWQLKKLEERREEQREILGFVRDASHDQRRRGGLLIGENPKPSLAWKEPLIIEAFDGMGSTITDMCQFGLRLPSAGPFLRKRTRLEGTPALVHQLGRLCPAKHEHTPVLGGMRYKGKWMNVSDYAGGYTSQFAKAVIEGAEKILKEEGRSPEVLVAGPSFPEEDLEEEQEEEKVAKVEKPQTWRIKQLHQRLGHPTNRTLSKMLSLAGASKETVEKVMNYECPTCQETQPPGRYLKASPELRTTIFGKELHCDLKYLHDSKNKLYVALSMVDGATSLHQAVLLRNRAAEHVAQKCLRHWISIHGAPQTMIVDQGGEFDGQFTSFLEQHGIHSKSSGAKSAWQHGFAERRGALLGTMFTSLAWQYKVEGRAQVKDALCAAVQAKNSTITRGGYTPYQLAFGRQPLFPDLLEEDVEGNMSLRESLSLEGEVQRAAEMRAAARATLLRGDVQAKLRRALRRWPKGQERDFEPGEMVYFYAPKPLSTRFKKEPGFWRGPALVIAKESHQRFFISWRGRCLLVSTANLRAASNLEGGDHRKRLQETEEFQGQWQGDDKRYEDMTEAPIPIEEEVTAKEAQGWEAHDGIISQRLGGRPKTRAKEIAKTLRGMKTIKTIQKHKMKKDDRLQLDGSQDKQLKTTEPKEKSEEEKAKEKKIRAEYEEKMQQVQEGFKKWLAQSEEEKFQDRLKQHLLDDVPQQFKKRPAEETPGQMTEDQLAKRFRPSFFSYTMVATIQKGERKRANQWASKNEVKKLRTLLDLPIASARFHFGARKRFQRPVNQKGMARVTVMMGEKEGMALVSQESKEEVKKRPGRKTPYLWKGVTLFLHQEDTKPPAKAQPVVVELPDGLYEVMVTDAEEWNYLARGEIENQAFFEALLLQMKTNGKELDPRFFNQEERKGFEESDRKEWESWVKNQVIRRLSPDEVKEVDKKNIFKARARIVRVNKGAMHGLFQPKSRMVIPGHLDPHLGQFRSDAPTSMWVCVQLAKAVCAYKHWMALTFDVTTAFLSGKEVDREVLIRAPPEGLPALPEHGEAAVKPGELLRVVKSAYGLSEAPRLWYLRARELLLEIGFEELAMAKATFVMRSKKNQEVQAILCLHVDDGLLVAAPSQAQKIRQAISERFAIKEWKNLAETAETFLGVKTTYKDHTFEDDMTEYINKVEYAPEETEQTKALEGKQLSAFRRLIVQLRWPAHHVLPEYLFRVSELAQRVGEANGGDLKYANKVLKSMKETASEGKAKTRIPPMKGELLLVSYFDASLGTSKSGQLSKESCTC